MAFNIIYDKPGEPTVYLGSADDLAGSDSDINAALPNAPAGTIITTAGFGTMKQLDAEGSWAAVE